MSWLRWLAIWGALNLAGFALAGIAHGQDPSAADLKYKAAVEKAAKDHEAALATARADYLVALQEELTEQTKQGNLDAALALREKVKALESQNQPTQSILKKLAGTTWINTNSVAFQWKDDGTFFHNGKERPCFPLDAQRVAIVFSNSHIDVLLFNEKFTGFEQFNTKGNDKPIMTGKRARIR